MNIKRTKLIVSITTLLLCLGVMCFGVYSATRVEYSIGGNITYEINAPFVDINTKLYRSIENITEAKDHMAEVLGKLDRSLNFNEGAFPNELIEEVTSFSDTTQGTYVNGAPTSETTFNSAELAIEYGYPSEDKAFVFYIVTKINNYGSNVVNFYLDIGDLRREYDYDNGGFSSYPYNTIASPLKTMDNISAGSSENPSTKYVILGLALNNPAISQESVDFSVSLQVNTGELTYNIDDFNFEYDVDLEGYRLTSYTGTSLKVVIPSTYDDGINGQHSVKALSGYWFEGSDNYDYITDVYLPEGIIVLESCSFDGLYCLSSLYLPQSVERLESWYYPYGLSTFIFPQNVNYFGGTDGSIELISYYVQEGNEMYTSVDGIIYSDNQKTLVSYPTGRSQSTYEILQTVNNIQSYAFSGRSKLTSIEIPSSVTNIGDYAFVNCSALQTVTFEDADSVWVLDNTSKTEISITEHTAQELTTYLTSTYYYYTWTKKQ